MTDRFARLRKESPAQHEINDEGLRIFEGSLPKSRKYKVVFTERFKNDYGTDGDLQIFENDKHTNEYYYIQLKSTSDARYIQKGKFLSFSLDLKSAFTLFEAQIPTVLIVVDTKQKKTYWYAIQLESSLLKRIEDNLALDKTKLHPLQIHIPVENILSKSNYIGFKEAIQKTSTQQSKKNILRLKDRGAFSISLNYLSELENEILKQEGYILRFRGKDDLPEPGVVFSITRNGRVVDYRPGPDFKPEFLPRVDLVANFSKKDPLAMAKSDELSKLRTGINDEIELESTYISKLVTTIGDKVIDEATPGHNFKLHIAPYSEKIRRTLVLNNGITSLLIGAELALSQNKMSVKSLDKQPLDINIEIDLTGTSKATYAIKSNGDYFKSFTNEVKVLDFLNTTEPISLGIGDELGLTNDMEGFKVSFNLGDDNVYKLKKMLYEIEHKAQVPIPYPLPETVTKNDIQYIELIRKLLDGEEVEIFEQSGYTKFSDKPDLDKLIGESFESGTSPALLFLFGKDYNIPNYKLITKGIISKIEPDADDGYKVKLKSVKVRLEKQ